MYTVPGVTDSFMAMTQIVGIMLKEEKWALKRNILQIESYFHFYKIILCWYGEYQIQTFEKINNAKK